MKVQDMWASHPVWQRVFHQADYLILAALERTTTKDDASTFTLSEASAVLVLILAKSVRLGHAALPLDAAELAELLRDDVWRVRGVNGEFVTAPDMPGIDELEQGVQDLLEAPRSVVEVLALSDPVQVTADDPSADHQPGIESDHALGLLASKPIRSRLVLSREHDRNVYLAYRRYAEAEEVVSNAVLESARHVAPIAGLAVDDVLANVNRDFVGELGVQAIRNALERSVSIVTGGPGRGKTTIVASLLVALSRTARDRDLGPIRVALGAPTAKAAVRMMDALSTQVAALGESLEQFDAHIHRDPRSGSVHRLLGIRPDQTKSLRSLTHDFVIIDEVSMLDISLLAKILDHVVDPQLTHIVFVGDADQLASVNVGAALRDMVDGIAAAELSGLVTELTVNYRSTKEIDEVATVIRSGVSNDVVAAIAQHAPAVEWVKTAQEAVDDSVAWARALRDTARAVTVESESRGAALDVLQRRAILCATHEGPNSVAWWRDIISRRLGAERAEANRFAVGTPILVTVNEQSDIANSERLSNGDLGVAVPSEDGAAVLFGPTSAPRLRRESEITSADEAWAMTIHKSQGSEYDTVVVSLPPASAQGLSRELLYTAVTRAKSKLVIVGSDAALRKAVEKKTSRCSGLVDRLRANATRGA